MLVFCDVYWMCFFNFVYFDCVEGLKKKEKKKIGRCINFYVVGFSNLFSEVLVD